MTRSSSSRSAAGYSLVEVLIAVAVTGFVLLTVVTLFYMGRRNVYSGKQMSYGVSVATRMLEDLSALTAADMLSNFGITDSTTRTTVTKDFPMPGTQYADSYVVDTKNMGTNAYLTNWQALITDSNLSNADAGLILTPRQITDATKPWTTAQIIRVRVFVTWDESNRRRTAYFDATKTNR